MRRSNFLTRKERLHIKWSNFKFFIYKIFHRVSRFQNWELNNLIILKPTREKMIISGIRFYGDGQLTLKKGDKNDKR